MAIAIESNNQQEHQQEPQNQPRIFNPHTDMVMTDRGLVQGLNAPIHYIVAHRLRTEIPCNRNEFQASLNAAISIYLATQRNRREMTSNEYWETRELDHQMGLLIFSNYRFDEDGLVAEMRRLEELAIRTRDRIRDSQIARGYNNHI